MADIHSFAIKVLVNASDFAQRDDYTFRERLSGV